MSVSEHRASPLVSVACFVVTVSDTRTRETDSSGDAIAHLLLAEGHSVVGRAIVPDEPLQVLGQVERRLADSGVESIITTGGTGVSRRDSTFEAVSALIEKHLDGFGELFRMLSYHEIGSAAMLSRATAGIASGRPIFVLPGSEHAVRLAMTRLILPEIGHIVAELRK